MEATTEQHLFAEKEYQLVQASSGKRFANYLIDLVVFYVLAFLIGMVMAVVNPRPIYDEGADLTLGENLFLILVFILYSFGFEAIFKGKSIGKFITGTRAVNEDGSNINAGTAFFRGLCRMVPFEPFSALGSPSYPWHDRWTKTYVIDEKASNRPEDI